MHLGVLSMFINFGTPIEFNIIIKLSFNIIVIELSFDFIKINILFY